jgi:hypothetical protein
MLGRARLGYVEWAGLNTVSTADAPRSYVLDDTICSPMERTGRTGRNTRRVGTVKTGRRNGQRPAFGKEAFLMGFDYPHEHTCRDIILKLA